MTKLNKIYHHWINFTKLEKNDKFGHYLNKLEKQIKFDKI